MAEPANRGAGCPGLPSSVKHIQLRESVFTIWTQSKGNSGFTDSIDSKIAEHLLYRR